MNKGFTLLLLGAVCGAISLTGFAAANSLAKRDAAGAAAVREIAWTGGDSLTIGVPANVRYVQSDGPARVIVTGPRRSVDRFTAEGGVLSDGRWRTGTPLDVVVYAPSITRFSLKGSDKLVVEAFDQPELTIETTGRSEVKATGRAGRVTLKLQGFGRVDLSGLSAADAEVTLSGARYALVAARESARISGNGSVVLVGKPAQLQLALGESGRVFTVHDAPMTR